MADFVRMTPWRVTLIAVDGTEVPGPEVSLWEKTDVPGQLFVDESVVFEKVPSDVYDRLRFEAVGHGMRLTTNVGPSGLVYGTGGNVTFQWNDGPAIIIGNE